MNLQQLNLQKVNSNFIYKILKKIFIIIFMDIININEIDNFDYGWNIKYEDILKQWKAQLFAKMWLQYESAYYYNIISNLLSYPIIILTAFSSATLFSTDNTIYKYIIGCISLFNGFLVTLSRQIKPGENYLKFILISKKYIKLIKKIDKMIDIPKNMRSNPEDFIDNIKNEIELLNKEELTPPIRIIRKFEKKYGKLDDALYGDNIIQLLEDDIKIIKNLNLIK